MTGLAQVAGPNMGGRFTACQGAVVTVGAGLAAYQGVIKHRGPGCCGMAAGTTQASGDMCCTLARCGGAIVTGFATANRLIVIDVDRG